jgi:23S rRNA pseudouridine2605 synthase
MSERLQKVLANAGFGSRREMEEWIQNGMIKVNGVVASLGVKVSATDRLQVKGKNINNPLNKKKISRVLIYHKPIGVICSNKDPEGRKTVFQDLPKKGQARWIMVGRLDINTSGLLLFTNNGELANSLMHPRYQIEREYAVRVFGSVDQSVLKKLSQGVELEDGPAKFNSIKFKGGDGANAWYHVTLSEGRNREVRRLWESQGVEVSRLIRVRYGPISLPRGLSRGQCSELTPDEVDRLLQLIEKK